MSKQYMTEERFDEIKLVLNDIPTTSKSMPSIRQKYNISKTTEHRIRANDSFEQYQMYVREVSHKAGMKKANRLQLEVVESSQVGSGEVLARLKAVENNTQHIIDKLNSIKDKFYKG